MSRFEGLTASKRRSTGGRASAGAVLGDAMELDELVLHEPRQELGHELAEDITVIAAEVVEAVIGDRDAAAQPAVSVELDEPPDLVDPSRRPRWWRRPGAPGGSWGLGGRGAGDLATGVDVGVEPAQIELDDDGGDRTHLVIGRHLGVEVEPPPR